MSMMNHLKHLSYRHSWCRLKRLMTSLSTSKSKIKLPARIERGPTDILHALDRTVPKDTKSASYKFQDDPFLYPIKSQTARILALSYESGKRTAMWIHKEHRDLFPKNLSEPEIKAFMPPVVYTAKSQVSEEVLLQAISNGNTSEAIDIYNLLEHDVSNKAKQALLELLCFYKYEENAQLMNFPHERWFAPDTPKMQSYERDILKLYQFLIKQDFATAAMAYNALICGLTRNLQTDEAWKLYETCKKKDIPLNVTTYNYIIKLIPKVFEDKTSKYKEVLFHIFKTMDAKGIQPNVRTLNAALNVTVSMVSTDLAVALSSYLFKMFEVLNIKPALGSYYYAVEICYRTGGESKKKFMKILNKVSENRFSMQTPEDAFFFASAMNVACSCYKDVNICKKINKILLTGDNYQFITNAAEEEAYFSAYMSLMLSTSTFASFLNFFREIVPYTYVPSTKLMVTIVSSLNFEKRHEISARILIELWSEVDKCGLLQYHSGLLLIELMESLSLEKSPESAQFADAAWYFWDLLKSAMEKSARPFSVNSISCIALLLIRGDRIKEFQQVLPPLVQGLLMPSSNTDRLNTLFNTCVSKRYVSEAISILKYFKQLECPNTTKMIHNILSIPELNDVDRKEAMKLLEPEDIEVSLDTSQTDKL